MNALNASKRITAKFDSTCTACKQICKTGQSVLWTPGTKGVKHVNCPVGRDTTLLIKATDIKARIAEFEAKLAELDVLRQDMFLETACTDAEDTKLCPVCEGKGFKEISWNASTTLDFTSFEHANVRCGSKAIVNDVADMNSWYTRFVGIEINGVAAEVSKVEYNRQSYDVYGGGNEECMANLKLHREWVRRRHAAEVRWAETCPMWAEVEAEIALCKKELEVRKGDIATVINRGKPYTGTVTFVGAGADFSRPYGTYRNHIPRNMPVRVTVRLADGTTKGGAIETAEFVSREETFSAA